MARQNDESSKNSSYQTETLVSGEKLSPGTLLAQRFVIKKAIGSGSQASVYEAYDQLLEIDVALKLISGAANDPQKMQTIRNEVLLARQLQHPNIIRVHDVFSDQSDAFFTMEYVAGEPLHDRLLKELSPAIFEQWQSQLLDAIATCQKADIKHGDLKPDNILIDHEDKLIVIDFGIGQLADTQSQTSGHHYYSAPEVIQSGKTSEKTDAYSVGMVFKDILEMVTLRPLSIKDWQWKRRQLHLIEALTHRYPKQRFSIEKARDQVNSKKGVYMSPRLLIAFTSLMFLALSVWFYQSSKSSVFVLDNKPVQLMILHDPDYPLLSTVEELLRYPLAAHPDIVLISKQSTSQLIENLALTPLDNEDEKIDLAVQLGADGALIIDATPTGTNSYLLSAKVLRMPGNTSVFTMTKAVKAETLGADIDNFSNDLLSALFEKLKTPIKLPEIRFMDTLNASIQTQTELSEQQAIDALIKENPNYPGAWVAKVNAALNEGDFAAAQDAHTRLQSLPDLGEYWQLQAQLLRAYIEDDLALAQRSIDALTTSFTNRPELLVARADIHQWANEQQKAIEDYQQALVFRPNDGQLWFELARLQIINGDIQFAIDNSLTKALIAFRQAKDKIGEGLVLNAFGVAYLRLAEHETAAAYFSDALVIRTPELQPAERVKTLANFALAASILSNYKQAESALKEAISLQQNIGNRLEEAQIHDTLGVLYEEQGLYKSALNEYKRGLDIRVQEDDDELKPESMSNVAYMHFLTGDFSLAEIYWEQAKTIFERNGDASHLIRTIQNLAQLSLARGNINTASRLLTDASEMLTNEQEQEQMYSHLLFSFFHFSNGKLSDAKKQLEQAEQLAQKATDTRATIEVNLWRGEICLYTADWKCLANSLSAIAEDVKPESYEQYAVFNWLSIGLQHHTGLNSNLALDLSFDEYIENNNIPIMTKLTILLDIQERFALPADSKVMQEASGLVKPRFYDSYLLWLYLKAKDSDEQSTQILKQQLALKPDYWRNHLYYSVFNDESEKQQGLIADWLNQLDEEQAINYRQAYFE